VDGPEGWTTVPGKCMGPEDPRATAPGTCMGPEATPRHRVGVSRARVRRVPQPDPGGAGGCQPAATQGLVNWNFSTVGPTKKSLWTEEPRGALSSGLAIRAWRTAVWFGSPL
jgi:hypothetical protein